MKEEELKNIDYLISIGYHKRLDADIYENMVAGRCVALSAIKEIPHEAFRNMIEKR